MAKFEKHDKIDGYEVLFFIKLGKYAETYRVKNKNGKQRFLKLINPSKLESYQIDKNGNIWWIATHIENVEPEEQAKRIQEMKENWTED